MGRDEDDLWAGLDAEPEQQECDDAHPSVGQARFWFLQRFAQDDAIFNLGSHFKVEGDVDVDALRGALLSVIERHESLRTGFTENDDGQPRRRVVGVVENAPFEVLPLTNPEAWSSEREDVFARPFDLAEPPLVRVRLYEGPEDERHLLVVVSHLVVDGTSLALVLADLRRAYHDIRAGRQPRFDAPATDYAEFVRWQRTWLGSDDYRRALESWRKQLEPPPEPIRLPADHRPGHRGRTRRHAVIIDAALASRIGVLGRTERATPFMVFAAAWQVFLAHHLGTRDVAVGTPVSGRPEERFWRSVGLFINTVAIRNQVDPSVSFREHLRSVRRTTIDALRHQDVPFAEVVSAVQPERRLHVPPIFQTLLVYNEVAPSPPKEEAALNLRREYRHQGKAVFDVELQISSGASVELALVYDEALFEPDTVAQFLERLCETLQQLSDAPDRPMSTLSLLSERDVSRLLDWAEPSQDPGPPASHVVDGLAQRRDDARPALRFGERWWSYAQLWNAAGDVARRLADRGVEPGDRVAVLADRSERLVAALLGIWRRGAAYVPVDPRLPAARINDTFEDSGATLVLSDRVSSEVGHAAVAGLAVVGLDDLEVDEDRSAGLYVAGPEAYLSYTSGSITEPRGVVVPHAAVANFLQSMAEEPGMDASDVLVAVTAFTFDTSILELFLPLYVGARVVVAGSDDAKDPERLTRLLEDATVMQATPATWAMLLASGWRGGVRALVGGDALSERLASRLHERCGMVWNLYGPAETTVCSLRWRVRPDEPILVGRPITGTSSRIVDAETRMVPPGAEGELVIGGEGVTYGYHARPSLTADRFAPDPYGPPGARVYRTGDFARWTAEGEVELLGGVDDQSKPRSSGTAGEVEASAYWRERLNGAPPVLELPLDRPRPKVRSGRGERVAVALSSELMAQVTALAEELQATPFIVLLATWKLLLSRYASSEEIVVGVPLDASLSASDGSPAEVFASVLPMRTDLSGDPTFARVVERVKEATSDAWPHRQVSFEKLVAELGGRCDASIAPLFQVTFALQPSADAESAHYPEDLDLRLSLAPDRDGELRGTLWYDGALFERATAKRMARHFVQLVSETLQAPGSSISEYALGSAAEHERLVEWNATAHALREVLCLHEAFEAQVDQTPDALALEEDGGERLSYRELDARANGVAWRLRSLGVGVESRVGVCFERSVDFLVGIYGVLKAGAAYVPLDPAHPSARLEQMAQDASMSVVLTHAPVASTVEALGAPIVRVEECDARSERVSSGARPWNAAYVIYTSGSTGRPKGVLNAHAGAWNRIRWQQSLLKLRSDETVLHKTPYSFDVSVWELFWALQEGARLLVARPEGHKDPAYLREILSRERVAVVHFVPSMLGAFLQEASTSEAGPRAVVCSGEALSYDLKERFFERFPNSELYNLYGPTEAAVDVSWWRCALRDGQEPVPIGAPVWNTQLHVMDEQLRPQVAGLSGELTIGGVQVSRGYLGRPALTAERFLPNPRSGSGERLYRTGDSSRWRSGGQLTFLGRLDFQVKLRGFRIELGEIESVLESVRGVQQAVAGVHRSRAGVERLVAWVLSDVDAASEQTLQAAAQEALPDYMIPSAFVRLEKLPLTSSGKVDRKRLPEPGGALPESDALELPRGPTEELVATLWQEALGLDRIDRRSDFFELGGDSIRLLPVASALRKRGYDVRIADFFQQRRLLDIASVLASRAASGEASATAPAIPLPSPEPSETPGPFELISAADREHIPEEVEAAYPMTRLQVGMVIEAAAGASHGTYHQVLSLPIDRPLSPGTVEGVLAELVRRHEVLRTVFAVTGYSVPLQLVRQEVPVALTVRNLAGLPAPERVDVLEQVVSAELSEPFDVESGPLFRVTLHTWEDGCQLTFGFHHAILDGWSVASLFAEFDAALRKETWDRPAMPYRHYVAAELAQLRDEKSREFWRSEFDGFETVAVVPRRLGEASSVDEPDMVTELGRARLQQLQQVARGLCVRLPSLFVAAHAAAMAALTGERDLVIGVVTHGRPGLPGAERTLGLFVNAQPLRVRLDGTWSDVVRRIDERRDHLQHFRQYPLAAVHEVTKQRTLFESLFTHTDFHVLDGASGLPIRGQTEVFANTNYPIEVFLSYSPTHSSARFSLNVDDSFTPAQKRRLWVAHERAIQQLLDQAESDYHALSLVEDVERRELLREPVEVETTSTQECLHDTFRRVAEASPGVIAVIDGQRRWTYGELEAESNRLARHLRTLGVGVEDVVGVQCDRSGELLVAILGVLKSGAGYLPLDPIYPADRRSFMSSDAGVRVIVGHSSEGELSDGPQWVALSDDAEWREEDSAPLESSVLPSNLAYVLYTSGSTGRPKGVQVTHRNVSRLLEATKDWFEFGADDVWTLFHSYAFDFSVWEMWGAFAFGGTLVVVPYETSRDPQAFLRLLEEHQVTVLNQTPSAFYGLIPFAGPDTRLALRSVIFGGEKLELQRLARWWQAWPDDAPRLVNMYGITETTVHVTLRALGRGDAERAESVIGRPISDLSLLVLDRTMSPQPWGARGELFVGGPGLSRGYLGRPGLTADRFRPSPAGGAAGSRLYVTGDVGRRQDQDEVVYEDRADNQVQLRGFRIELGEVEAALTRLEGVRDAAVLVQSFSGRQRLLGFVVGERELDSKDRLRLETMLPGYMVPSLLVRVDELPLTPNGKLDRRALTTMLPEGGWESGQGEAPRGGLEEIVAQLWAHALGVRHVSRDDDFFALGGDSLSILPVLAGLRERGFDIEVADVFASPVLKDVAETLRIRSAGPTSSPAPGAHQYEPFSLVEEADRSRLGEDVVDAFPMSLLQQGMVFHQREDPQGETYHDLVVIRLRGTPPTDRLRRALQAAVDRHPALRSSFHLEGYSTPLVLVARHADAPLRVVDWRGASPAEVESKLEEFVRTERGFSFDIERAPLLRIFVHRLSGDEDMVSVSFHHGILDGWSLSLLLSELLQGWVGVPVTEPGHDVLGLHAALEHAVINNEETARFWERRGESQGPPLRLRSGGEREVVEWDVAIEPEVASAMLDVARERRTSVKSVFLAAHLAVQATLSGVRRVTTGLTVHTRPEESGTTALGMFLNTVPLTVEVRGRWSDLVELVRDEERRIFPHQRYPFPEMLRRGFIQRYGTAFNFVHFRSYREAVESEIEVLDMEMVERGELPLAFQCRLGAVDGQPHARVQTHSLPEEMAQRIRGYYEQALRLLATRPDEEFVPSSLLSESERREVAVQLPKASPSDPLTRSIGLPTVVDDFVSISARCADVEAVVALDRTLTYGELAKEADELSRHLTDGGVGAEDLVSVRVDRGAASVVAILAVARSGAAYVPIAADEAPERVEWMKRGCRAHLDATSGRVSLSWSVRGAAGGVSHAPAGRLLAYVIYTSGTTGTPKGVEIEHAALANTVRWARGALKLGPGVRSGHIAPMSFDAGNRHLFDALSSGATIVIAPNDVRTDPEKLVDWVKTQRTEVLNAAPVLLRSIYARIGELTSIRAWSTGGEPLTLPSGDRLPFDLLFEYGPTEVTVCSSCHHVAAGTVYEGSLPIGRPIPGATTYVLDEGLDIVPAAVTSQLCLGGAGVGRGYRGSPALTADRFRPDPRSEQPGDRIYLTGDHACWLPSGDLHFEGRRDRQVKLRGYRIEVDEVEAAMGSVAGVEASAVIVVGAGTSQRLVGFGSPRGRWTSSELRRELGERLPAYMIPSSLVLLDSLPMKQNGKVDATALADIAAAMVEEREIVPPASETERRLASVWAALLGVDEVGREDDFFALGGHSLLVTRLVSTLASKYEMQVSVAAVFSHPVLAELATLLDEQPSGERAHPAITPLGSRREPPTLYLVHAADGDPSCYVSAASVFAPDMAVVGLRSPSLFASDEASQRIESIHQLVTPHADAIEAHQPEGPLRLGGWSLGGFFAHAVAGELRRRGREIELLLLLDATLPHGEPPTDEEVAEYLRREGATAAGGRRSRLSEAELASEATLWAGHLRAAYRHRLTPLDKVPTLAVLCGDQTVAASAWKALTEEPSIVSLDVGHYDLLEQEPLERVREGVRALLWRRP